MKKLWRCASPGPLYTQQDGVDSNPSGWRLHHSTNLTERNLICAIDLQPMDYPRKCMATDNTGQAHYLSHRVGQMIYLLFMCTLSIACAIVSFLF